MECGVSGWNKKAVKQVIHRIHLLCRKFLVYFPANVTYDISKKGSDGVTQFEQLDHLFAANGGILKTAHVVSAKIPKPILYDYVKERGVEQAAHGIYISAEAWTDAMYLLHLRCSQAVFSHETALFFHDLTDREPAQYAITVRTGYNPSALKSDGVQVYTIKKDLHEVGVTMMKTPFGHDVPVYDMERTICDIVRSPQQCGDADFPERTQTIRSSKRQGFTAVDALCRAAASRENFETVHGGTSVMIKTAKQLKDLIRNLSKAKAADAQLLMRNYMMERFLERISLSEYRDKFILKGGMLVAAMVGLDARSTMDLDATIKGATVGVEEVENIMADIVSTPIEDGVVFRVKRISEIMDEAEYPGIRVSMETEFDRVITPLKIDISTATPLRPMRYGTALS